MSRSWLLPVFFAFALVTSSPVALAQGPIADAAAEAPPAGAPASPPPVPTSTSTGPRSVRGPAVRERGGRRSRGGSTASGALMLVILIGFLGYYVVKKLRR